jgi:hypothetical protein
MWPRRFSIERWTGVRCPEAVVVGGEHATIRLRYRFGPGVSDYVPGVNLMTVRNGAIVEALGYSKTHMASVPS